MHSPNNPSNQLATLSIHTLIHLSTYTPLPTYPLTPYRPIIYIPTYLHTPQALIDDDETMALMNLTLLRDNPLLYRFPLHRYCHACLYL